MAACALRLRDKQKSICISQTSLRESAGSTAAQPVLLYITVKSGGGGRKSTHFPALQGTATAAGNVTGSLSVSSADSDDAHRNKKTWQPWPTHSPFPSMEMIRYESDAEASWANSFKIKLYS
jgi:hypothetical protein